MSTNLRVLTKETQPQYAPQCPVLLEACALYGDSASGRCVAQLKWRALVPGIRALSVIVHTYDAFGEPVESTEYQYAEISAASGECFGSREAVRLRSSKGRSMSVCVSAASLDDGSVWTMPGLWEVEMVLAGNALRLRPVKKPPRKEQPIKVSVINR